MDEWKNEQMRVAIVGPMHPYRGGIAHFLEKMEAGLRERGHETVPVTFTRQYPELLFPGKTQYVEDAETTENDPVRLLDSLNPWTWYTTARHLARREPDVVVFKYWMSYFAPSFGSIARYLRRQGVRVVAVVDNALPHERRPGDKVLGKFFLRACDGLIVMSDEVEGDLHELGIEAPIRRVNHPIYNTFGEARPRGEARDELDLPADAPVLLFFGFVRRYKGLHVLLEAMPQIVERLPDVRLVVAGEFYDKKAFYENIIETHGLGPYLHLHDGYVSDEDVAAYFSAADVVVQPYVSATQSGVAKVAYHFERPLIMTDVGGLAEMMPDGEAGLVVSPEDPQALSNAVCRFFEEGLQDKLTEGVRREKAKYSWTPLYEAVERFGLEG
jgi:glycosyltransferase involved in cell wall biosynthesis